MKDGIGNPNHCMKKQYETWCHQFDPRSIECDISKTHHGCYTLISHHPY